MHFVVTDNEYEIIQQLLSHDSDFTLKADKELNILHLAAIHGDTVTMNVHTQAGLRGVDAERSDYC